MRGGALWECGCCVYTKKHCVEVASTDRNTTQRGREGGERERERERASGARRRRWMLRKGRGGGVENVSVMRRCHFVELFAVVRWRRLVRNE
jgi:hypothetical protein